MSTLDWAAFSEADEESRQALFRRAAKLEPAIQVALQSSAKKGRKKGVETAEAEPKKAGKVSSKKSASCKKTEESVAGVGSSTKESVVATVVGSSAWVAKQMESVGLLKLVARFSGLMPLELLVHVELHQLDTLLRSAKTEPFPEPIDYIKLQCLIRSMHVQVTGNTGNANKLRSISASSTSALSSPSSSSASSSSSAAVDVSTLLQGDILLWDVSAVQAWLNSVPALRKFADSFEHNQIDGHRLLRLNDRKLLQRLKMESDADRTLLMQHVGDLKALQLTRAASTHSDILNKLIEGLSSELSQLHKVSANPATSLLLSSKRVPNYFLSLRIGCLDLRTKVKKIQAEIETLVPELSGSRSMLPPEQLHFTLGRLYLQTDAEIALAKKLLVDCYEKVYQSLYPENAEVAVNFKGVTNYGGNTVFLETERGNERDVLIEFGNTVYDIFQAAGLTSKEFRFQPVAPILRVRQSKKPLMMRLQEASATLLESYANASLGRNVFSSLDISAVADQTDSDGYYKTLHSVALH